MVQPRHPPRPAVPKIAALDRVGGGEVASRGLFGRDSDILFYLFFSFVWVFDV